MKITIMLAVSAVVVGSAQAALVAPNADWATLPKQQTITSSVFSAPADMDPTTAVSGECILTEISNTIPAEIAWVCFTFIPDLDTVDPSSDWNLQFDAGGLLFEATGVFDLANNEVDLTLTRNGILLDSFANIDLTTNPEIDLGLLVQPVAGNFQVSYELQGDQDNSLGSGQFVYSNPTFNGTYTGTGKSVTLENEDGDTSSIPTAVRYQAYKRVPEPTTAALLGLAGTLLHLRRRRR